MSSSVYEVVDVQSGQVVYVGKANDVYERWHNHVSHATSPLVQAMVANGVERYAPRIVATFPSVAEALQLEQTMIEEGGDTLLNRHRPQDVPARVPRTSATWNGRLLKCGTYGTWFGKWRAGPGDWRQKRVPAEIRDQAEALTWFAEWVKQADSTAVPK